MTETVRVRFPPSPTGVLHLGGARTALYNWLFARHHGGTFILRIEDTDEERSTEGSVDAILEGLTWLGITWDEGPFRQRDRLALYRESVEKLLREGKAYYCVCTKEELAERRAVAAAAGRTPRYDGRCRSRGAVKPAEPAAIRLRIPEGGRTTIQDLIHGEVVFDDAELEDLVLIRSDGLPTYNFAVVVDDAVMAITHVIRGDDHLSNTPKQIKLYEALNLPIPRVAHVPMILGPDRTRLSKRHGATSVLAYRGMGYLPEAMVNYLARLGWSHGDQEIFTREELITHFGLEKVSKAAALFDPVKLEWLNGQYLRQTDPSRLVDLVTPFWEEAGVPAEQITERDRTWLVEGIRLFQERSKTLRDLALSSRCLFRVAPDRDPEAQATFLDATGRQIVAELARRLATAPDFTAAAVEEVFRGYAAERGVKVVAVAQPVRVILTGKTVSPPLFPLLAHLGRERVLAALAEIPPAA